MKFTATTILILALSASGYAMAQSGGAKGMDKMGMKSMPMDNMAADAGTKAVVHQATGVVKAADPVKGTVTLAHGPVKTLNWPAMTMRFAVKDKTFFDKLAVDKKVTVDFAKQGADYVVTAVK